jgi:pimeloyl-ACP methyl ester carboxylesterase
VKSLVFVPGGPGFTAKEEARVLGPRLEAAGWHARFWDDPTRSDPTPRPTLFDDYLASLQAALGELAGQQLTIVSHSAGVHGVLIALERAAVEAMRIVMIAPSLSGNDAFRRVLGLAADDFEESQPEQAQRIRTLLGASCQLMDDPMREGLTLAAQDPQLFAHYWRDQAAFESFVRTTSQPDAQFRPDTFFAVMDGLATYDPSYLQPIPPLAVPAVIVFGDCDPVVDPAATLSVARRTFSQLDVRTFNGAGHWLHLERPDDFVTLL